MEDDSLRQPDLDLISPKDFVSRLTLVTRTILLMLLYVAIVSSSQLDEHGISLGLKIWDLSAFCTHLIWIKYNLLSPFIFTSGLIGSIILFIMLSLFGKWVRKKFKTKSID